MYGNLGVLGQLSHVFDLRTYIYYHSLDSEKISQAIDDWNYPTKNMKKIVSDEQIFYTLGPAPHRILFVGDSNAWQYAPRVDQLVSSGQSKKSAIFTAVGGCPFPDVGRSECEVNLINETIQYACERFEVQTVVIAALWAKYRLTAFSYYGLGKKRSLTDSGVLNLIIIGFENFISKLIAQGKKVYLVTSIPCGKNYDPTHLTGRTFFGQWHLKLSHAARSDWDKANAQSTQILNRIAQRTGAILIHPEDFFCNTKVCRTYHIDGTPIYKDKHHLRATYVANHVTFLDFLFLEQESEMAPSGR